MSIILKISHKDKVEEVRVKTVLTVGRSSKADVTIKDSGLSSVHGQFKVEESGKLFYEDLSSKNGSSINGMGVYASQFMMDDVLLIGSVEITVDVPSLTTYERKRIGERNTRLNKKNKDITLVKDEK